MKKFLFLLILSLHFIHLNAQKKTTVQKQKLVKNQISIGYADEYEKLPKLEIKPASQKDFDQLLKHSFWSKPKVNSQNGYFYINTSAGKQKFKQYKDEGIEKGWNGNEILGYSKLLNLYAITSNSTSEGIGFGDLSLLDTKSGFQYHIVSFGDWYVSLPNPSPDNQYFAYYYNASYQHKNSDIGILRFDPKAENGKRFTITASFLSDDFAIEEIKWANGNDFYIKGYEEVYNNQKWSKNYKYYKASLPVSVSAPDSNQTVKLHGTTFYFKSKEDNNLLIKQPDGSSIKTTAGELPENGNATRQYTIADYNFDGYNDIAFSVPDMGMGVYYIFDIWIYNPSTHKFSLLSFPEQSAANCSCFCDITIDRKNKQLISSCRGGAKWWQDRYQFNKKGQIQFVKSSK